MDENLSGAFDYERQQWEEELARDPGYVEWLKSIEAMALEQEKDYGDHGD